MTLSRRGHRENDRITVLYSEDYGRIPVRFIGVNRPRGKLKALSEPMVRGEYRIYFRDRAEFCLATGGVLISVYPGIRRRYQTTFSGLGLCGLLEALTPPWNPSPEKFDLICASLAALDALAADDLAPVARAAAEAWVSAAFALRLFEAAGFGLRERRVSEDNRKLWEFLHQAPFGEISRLPEDAVKQRKLAAVIEAAVCRLTDRPLWTQSARERILT